MAIRVGFKVEAKRGALMSLLNALVSLNRHELKTKRLPWLYKAGVRYQRETGGGPEEWKTFSQVVADKVADCEDLAAARVAELNVRKGIAARPWLKKKNRTWHAVVRYPDGTIEDPSKILGMGAI